MTFVCNNSVKKDIYYTILLSHEDGINLALYNVVRLSEKEYDLEWSDFDIYSYYETGCGLYIRDYIINEKFFIRTGGTGTYRNALMAMYFYLELDDGNYIDIHTDNVKNFIDKH